MLQPGFSSVQPYGQPAGSLVAVLVGVGLAVFVGVLDGVAGLVFVGSGVLLGAVVFVGSGVLVGWTVFVGVADGSRVGVSVGSGVDNSSSDPLRFNFCKGFWGMQAANKKRPMNSQQINLALKALFLSTSCQNPKTLRINLL